MMSDLAALVGGFEDDPEVRAAMKQLAMTALGEAQSLLTNAIPSVKMQLIKSLLPTLSRSLQVREGEDLAEFAGTVAKMYAEIVRVIGVPGQAIIELPVG